MVFDKWDGSLRDAIDTGLVRGLGCRKHLPIRERSHIDLTPFLDWGLLTAVGLMKDVSRAVAFMHKHGHTPNPARLDSESRLRESV